jgi:hypothetical protein
MSFTILTSMTNANAIRCDGCGQLASPEHLARRLKRLELTTRYRPIHIGVLFLGAAAPSDDLDFLYAPDGTLRGEAQTLLQATSLKLEGKPRDVILAEFQRGGFSLAHVLECPFEPNRREAAAIHVLLQERLPFTVSRIRRSLKPKSLIPISRLLEALIPKLHSSELACAVALDDGKPFALDGEDPTAAVARLRGVLGASAAARGA